MSSITIKVEDAETGTVSMHSFARSPVRIGRSSLNNLTLDRPFVSGYHAVARFDENGLTLTDLGSRNGTIVDGATLEKNVPVMVGKDGDVRIGMLKLTFVVFDDGQAEVRPGVSTPGWNGVGASNRAGVVQAPQPMPSESSRVGWPVGTQSGPPGPFPPVAPQQTAAAPFTPAAPQQNAAPFPQAAPYAPASPFPSIVPSGTAQPYAPVAPYAPASSYPPVSQPASSYAPPEASGGADAAALAAQPSIPGAGMTRMIVDGEVARMVQEAVARGPVQESRAIQAQPSAASPSMAGIAARPMASSPAFPAVAAVISRESLARTPPEVLVDTLETFAKGFVELRKGYQEFGSEMGLRPVTGSTPLHRAREPREILQYLFEAQGDRRARLQELVSIFADFMIHEIALMNGIKEGLRKLVADLDPELVEDARKPRGLRMFEGGKAIERYTEHFRQVTEDGGHSVVFGPTFARAYAAAVGNRKDRDE